MSLVSDLQKLISARQQLDAQLNENKVVQEVNSLIKNVNIMFIYRIYSICILALFICELATVEF